MKDFLDKLGLYDYLGIWWPGAISVTYYLLTLQSPLRKLFQFIGMEDPGFKQGHWVIILYTVIAYMIGVILHETGKLFSDWVLRLRAKKCQNNAYNPTKSSVFFRGIRNDFATSIEETIPEGVYKTITFHQANYGLRFNRNADKKKIESHHAVYALSRSLFLCFLSHSIAEVIAFCTDCVTGRNALIMISTDIFLIILFGIRTVRYYYSWIKNLIIHYYFECKSEKEMSSVPEKA